MAISGNQLKAARALAGLDQKSLAARAGVGVNTIRNLETAAAGNVAGRIATLDAVAAALKSVGVIFVEDDGGGPGVRLRKAAAGVFDDLLSARPAESGRASAIPPEDLNASNDS
jgi:transcriptional regulator with XRE-family HTH domain